MRFWRGLPDYPSPGPVPVLAKMTYVSMAALALQVGATPEELDDLWEIMRPMSLPLSMYEAYVQASEALAMLRGTQ